MNTALLNYAIAATLLVGLMAIGLAILVW